MIYIACTGGGTGGHIYPGLAVCDELRVLLNEKDTSSIRFLWIGNYKGMDKTIVEKSGSIDVFKGIPCGKLRRYVSFKNVVDILNIAAGFIASLLILIKYKPVFLFSKGGFVSVPPCYAARLLRISVFTHECDITPGLATRLNSTCAKNIFISYDKSKSYFSQAIQSKLIVTGNPVRPIFYEADSSIGLRFLFGNSKPPSLPILFILGGSSGALQINNLIYESYEWICSHFFVVHQTGKNVSNEHTIQHANYQQYEFIYQEMCHVLAASDIVLARSGANTLWEAAVQGKPMILIPLCGSGTRGDQVENAQFFEDQGAAEVLLGNEATAAGLEIVLKNMLDSETRKKYAVNAHKLVSNVKPAEFIAHLLYNELEDKVCL